MNAWLAVAEPVQNKLSRCPVLIVRRSRWQSAMRNAFELGNDAGLGGLEYRRPRR